MKNNIIRKILIQAIIEAKGGNQNLKNVIDGALMQDLSENELINLVIEWQKKQDDLLRVVSNAIRNAQE